MTPLHHRDGTVRAAQDLLIRVAGDHLLTSDGHVVGALLCEEVDLLAAEPWRREAAIAALRALLRSLSAELVLRVGVRRAASDPDARSDDPLEAALHRHWSTRLVTEPAFHRQVAALVRHRRAEVVERELAAVADALAAAGIRTRRLGGPALGDHLEPMGLDLCRTAFCEQPQQARIGERLVRAALLDRLPGGPVQPGWLAPLVRCGAEVEIAVHLEPTTAQAATRQLSRRLRHLGAHRMAESERGSVPDAAVEAGLESALRLRERLARNTGRPLRMWLTAVAVADDAQRLSRGWAQLRGAFAATAAVSRPAHFEHLPAALSTCALGRPAGPGKLVDSEAAASGVPWVQTSIDDPGGYRLGRMADSGLPLSIDPFDQERHPNANIGIFAASGQGKSFLIGGLLVEARRLGAEAIVVDPEGEYRTLMRRLGGDWLDLVSEAAINPFDLGEDEASACASVVDTCSTLCAGVSELEGAAIEATARDVLRRARAEGAPPLLRHCVRPLDRTAPRVARVLERHLAGSLAGFLDRPTSPAWSRPLLAVGHREVREELVPTTTLLLGRLLWDLVRRVPRRRHIVLDEVGMLSGHPALRDLLVQLARRCRKHGSSLVVATQNVQDLLRSDEGTVVASNCAVVFCGGHRAVEVGSMERAFGLTEDQRVRLEQAPRGEFLLVAGRRRGMVRVDLPGAYAEMITG
jgi:hypothetical protein